MSIRAETQTTHLGRYIVVKRLAAGGMADVLLARTDGIEGFQRHVVIKRIHAELLEEPRYVKMFLDEARLAATLHHHNIVQVNDIGEEGGEYFFAMEYVHGEDARTLLVEASKRDQQIPLEHVITIVTAAAAGLHHAHEQRGSDGNPLAIVHRDVSPANILVGYDGAVKVADFGIALASHRAEHTQSGILKGKVAYMSPEQCNCEPVDRRSDVFSLGIVLYELATVRPCFAGENDFLTMSAIVNGRVVRPSLIRADIAAQLEAIIMKALASNPAERYQTADEMRLALEQFAADTGLRNSTTALADYMKRQFGTKALPWQDDDDEPELVITGGEPTLVPDRPVIRVPTQPRGVRTLPRAASPRERTPAPTAPLRAVAREDDLAIPLAPRDRDEDIVAAVSEQPRTPTLPLHVLTPRSPAATSAPVNLVVGLPTTSERKPIGVAPARSRRLWLAGAIAAVAIAAAALVFVSRTRTTSAPRASAAPAVQRVAPQPIEKPTLVGPADPEAAIATPAEPPAEPEAATKRSQRKSKKAPAKRWDPDALFPQ